MNLSAKSASAVDNSCCCCCHQCYAASFGVFIALGKEGISARACYEVEPAAVKAMIATIRAHLVTMAGTLAFHIFAANEIVTVTIKTCQCHCFLVDVTINYYP